MVRALTLIYPFRMCVTVRRKIYTHIFIHAHTHNGRRRRRPINQPSSQQTNNQNQYDVQQTPYSRVDCSVAQKERENTQQQKCLWFLSDLDDGGRREVCVSHSTCKQSYISMCISFPHWIFHFLLYPHPSLLISWHGWVWVFATWFITFMSIYTYTHTHTYYFKSMFNVNRKKTAAIVWIFESVQNHIVSYFIDVL